MDAAAVAERLSAGGEVVDIGQLSDDATRYLRREIAAKRAELFVSYAFPAPQRGYVAVGARPVAAEEDAPLARA